MDKKEIREVDVLKGRLAEELVKLLFEESGYEVYCSGMEHILPLYAHRQINKFDNLEAWIRTFPDFLVVKNGKSYFLEVKYVTKFYKEFYTRFEHYPDYPHVFIVCITPQGIDCRTLEDIKNGIRFDNVYKKFLKELEARNEEAKEQNIEVDEEEINNVFPKYVESLNRLNLLGISKEQREQFYLFFLSTAREILKVTEERIIDPDKEIS
jgi:hypothetical protein